MDRTKPVKLRLDLLATAPASNEAINLDNIIIDKIQTIRVYDKSNSKKILTLKEKDVRDYLHLGKRKGKSCNTQN